MNESNSIIYIHGNDVIKTGSSWSFEVRLLLKQELGKTQRLIAVILKQRACMPFIL